MRVCQVCGKENPSGAEYCEDCGAALTATNAPAPVGAAAPTGASAGPSAAGSTGGASVPTGGPSPLPSSGSAAPPSGSAAPASGSAAPPSDAAANPGAPTSPPSAPATPPPAAGPAAGATGTGTPPASGSLVQPGAPLPTETTTAPTGGAGTPGAPTGRLIMVRYGAPTGQEVPLLGQRLVVGRFDPETGPVDIDLSDAPESGHISRQHGELYREGDAWMVRDLGSTNGVFVKTGDAASFGPRITAPHALKDGDEVAFGNARFIFRTA